MSLVKYRLKDVATDFDLPVKEVTDVVAKFYEKFKENKIVSGVMTGLKPCVVGLILSAVLSIGQTVFFKNGISIEAFSDAWTYVKLGIFLGMSVLAFKKVHPIIIICLSAVIGIAVGYLGF
jgi:chromate transporter